MQRMIGRMYWEQANRTQTLEHYYKALAILEQGPESVELASAIDGISQVMMLTHDNDQGILWGERAIKMAEALGAESVVVNALNNIGCSYAQRGDYEKGNSLLQESIRRAIAAGLPQIAGRSYFGLFVMYQRQCQYKKAVELTKEAFDYSIKYHTKIYTYYAIWRLMWINWYTGHWDAALNYRSKLFETSGALHQTWTKRVLGMIDLDLGMVKEALSELEESLPYAVRADEYQTTVPHWGQMARVYAACGQDEKMVDAIDQILEFVNTRSYQSHEAIMPLLIACQLTAAQGTSSAAEIAHTCVAYLERHARQFHTEEAHAALAEARGVVSLAEEHPLEAAEQFRLAVSQWEMIERRYDQARALGYLGRALQMVGEPAEAGVAYQQASEIITALAIQLDPDHQTSFLASLMVMEINQAAEALEHTPLQKKARQEAGPLTERELEVLKLVAEGLTNAQIAERLVLSPLTVNAHLRSIFNKLNVNTRTAAVRQAMELGLV
jgi:ATP/maltotriose-dependent transcriptional regulator MalT